MANDATLLEQAARLERLLPALLRRLFTLDPEHPATALPIGQLRVCTILQDGPHPLSVLSERLRITPSAVTQIADRLERAGYVERTMEAEDRRVRNLRLSECGAAFMRSRREYRTRQAAEALSGMSAEERDALLRVLESLSGAAAALPAAVPDGDPIGVRQEQS